MQKEVARILSLRPQAFPSAAAWGFAVLGVGVGMAGAPGVPRNAALAQRGYRAMMKVLHPDKVGQCPRATRAVEIVREAKDACERSLLRLQPPGMPRRLRSTPLCETPGRRQFRLEWAAPGEDEGAPVRRYEVAVVDPAYGRALTVAVLEPDYNQELRRYVDIGDLTSYILAEQELEKMPRLWQQPRATVHVAAGNEAGQSSWATLEVPLKRR